MGLLEFFIILFIGLPLALGRGIFFSFAGIFG